MEVWKVNQPDLPDLHIVEEREKREKGNTGSKKKVEERIKGNTESKPDLLDAHGKKKKRERKEK